MNKMPIAKIQQLLFSHEADDALIDSLEKDERAGVRRLLEKWKKQQQKEQELLKKFIEMTQFERKLRSQGYKSIAGIDEVGRGPLAGPVVAAAVILPEDFYLPGVDDSKKLNEQKREELFERIQQEAKAIGIGVIEAAEIDEINILEASKKAMLQAIVEIQSDPDYLLVDAVRLETPYPSESLIKGDARSISIAAASIVAKVTRDRMMKKLDGVYPQYGFASNMGYGTAAHLDALKKYGATPIHRMSFAPVKLAGK
ncbi:ribonuclease H [Mesobacillus campisalis]|uniref:Ribonuclease HII n=1 Tax=Mesobacillus campisalis TaxID=1408103 RepID=A0A0M2T454_9BACI|nr:ribonuclease HII [Mesobacillus campisalis]KKK39585.1 ribonuclease H [Mesobacillus campisalis]